MTIVEAAPGIRGGVDTHLDKHVAAALDPLGRLVGTGSFDANAAGYKALLAWLEEFGQVTKVGVEGTGSYGVGLARYLRRKGVEVNRPNRLSRRNQGKSDPLDAVEAGDFPLPIFRIGRRIRIPRRSVEHLLSGLPLTPPEGRSRWPTGSRASIGSSPSWTRKSSYCSWPAPDLMALFGVGPDTGASLLVAAGDKPERLHSEAAWAHLCGVSPVPADSGKNAGHFRRHQGGDRQANSALWRIAMVRIAHDPETTHYFDRRVKKGRTKRDVIRILQRYIAREVYRYLPRG
jgi:transposase